MYRKQKRKKPEIDIFSTYNCRYIFSKRIYLRRKREVEWSYAINQSISSSRHITFACHARGWRSKVSNIWVTGSWQHIIQGIATGLSTAFYCAETFKNKYFDESPDNYWPFQWVLLRVVEQSRLTWLTTTPTWPKGINIKILKKNAQCIMFLGFFL